MGGRKFFVTVVAVFSFLLISVSAYAATMTVDGSLYLVNPISNEYGITAGLYLGQQSMIMMHCNWRIAVRS